MVLLGLAHAEQMRNILIADIEDQKENGFYSLAPFQNQLRLRNASDLVSVTEILMYILTSVASVYLLSTIALFFGIYKNRSELVLPWLIVELIFIVTAIVLIIWLRSEKFVQIIGGKICYCKFRLLFYFYLFIFPLSLLLMVQGKLSLFGCLCSTYKDLDLSFIISI